MRHRGIKRRNQKSLVGGMERDEHLEWVGEKKKSGERKRKEDRRGGGVEECVGPYLPPQVSEADIQIMFLTRLLLISTAVL